MEEMDRLVAMACEFLKGFECFFLQGTSNCLIQPVGGLFQVYRNKIPFHKLFPYMTRPGMQEQSSIRK